MSRRVAIHEAGHALWTLHKGRDFFSIELEPDPSIAGAIFHSEQAKQNQTYTPPSPSFLTASTEVDKRVCKELIKSALAGIAAELALFKTFDALEPYFGDIDLATHHLNQITLNPIERLLIIKDSLNEVRSFFNHPLQKKNLRHVARALLKQRVLSCAEVLKLIKHEARDKPNQQAYSNLTKAS